MNRFRSVFWRDGTVLQASQLNSAFSQVQGYVAEVSGVCGIVELELDRASIGMGKLRVLRVRCFLRDRTFIDFNGEYELSRDLSLSAEFFVEPRKLYFCKDREMVVTEGDMEFSFPKLVLSDQPDKESIPFVEIQVKSGGFFFTDYVGPTLSIRNHPIVPDLESFCERLRNKIVLLKTKEEERSKDLLKATLEVLMEIQCALINLFTPRELYLVLIRAIAVLAWSSTGIPVIKKFDPDNSFECLGLMLNQLKDLVGTVQLGSFSLKDGIWECFIGDKDFYIIVEPNTPETFNWISTATIASKPCFDYALIKRCPGIERVVKDQGSLLVELDRSSEYFCKSEPLLIVDNGTCLSLGCSTKA